MFTHHRHHNFGIREALENAEHKAEHFAAEAGRVAIAVAPIVLDVVLVAAEIALEVDLEDNMMDNSSNQAFDMGFMMGNMNNNNYNNNNMMFDACLMSTMNGNNNSGFSQGYVDAYLLNQNANSIGSTLDDLGRRMDNVTLRDQSQQVRPATPPMSQNQYNGTFFKAPQQPSYAPNVLFTPPAPVQPYSPVRFETYDDDDTAMNGKCCVIS